MTCRCAFPIVAARNAACLPDLQFNPARHIRIGLQEFAHIVPALPDAVALVAVPGAGFLDQAMLNAEFYQLAFPRHPFVVEDVEMRLFERRRNLVLDHFHARLIANHFVATLERPDAPNVQPDRRVELERIAAGGRFRAPEHDTDFHANLIDENDQRI